MSNEVVLTILLGGFFYMIGDLTIAVISVIVKKPLACAFFGLIGLIGACALSAMIRGDLFPEFRSFILQSQTNFIPALWGLVILGFISVLLLLFRSVQLMIQGSHH